MKKTSSLFLATSLLLSTAMATPASAVTLLYSFAPTSAGAQRFTFNVDSNPVPSFSAPFMFTVSVQNLTVAGVTQIGANSFDFFPATSSGGGGFENIALLGSYTGPQLFSGSTSAPTLLTGTFGLVGEPANASGTLTVAVVPEPATWAMMVIGFGLAGVAMRRRKVTTRVSYAL